MVSKTQVDRLGERLRQGKISEADLRLLDDYRRSFSLAYDFVVGAIRNELGLEPTGRPAKSTTSNTEKLLRESIRLSQVQDIAGCRVVVPGIAEQEGLVSDLRSLFHNVTVVDRREQPNNGYRAIHLIVSQSRKLVEIQVRTLLQHGWAELSEKASDLIDPALKYGGGDPSLAQALLKSSALFAVLETRELQFVKAEIRASRLFSLQNVPADKQEKLRELKKIMDDWRKQQLSIRAKIMSALQEVLEDFPPAEISDAVSD